MITDESVSENYTEIELRIRSPVSVNGELVEVEFADNALFFSYSFHKKEELQIKIADFDISKTVTPIPLWMSILPPLIAIMMALIIREVLVLQQVHPYLQLSI